MGCLTTVLAAIPVTRYTCSVYVFARVSIWWLSFGFWPLLSRLNVTTLFQSSDLVLWVDLYRPTYKSSTNCDHTRVRYQATASRLNACPIQNERQTLLYHSRASLRQSRNYNCEPKRFPWVSADMFDAVDCEHKSSKVIHMAPLFSQLMWKLFLLSRCEAGSYR